MRSRRSTKTAAERIFDLRAAIQRSGFNGLETAQMLVDWYGWRSLTIVNAADQLEIVLASPEPPNIASARYPLKKKAVLEPTSSGKE